MAGKTYVKLVVGLFSVAFLAACGSGDRTVFGKTRAERIAENHQSLDESLAERSGRVGTQRSTIWDLFQNRDDPNVTVEVNRYIWNATLEVLNFMPIESADPFSGVIVYGYGTPPGGRTAYRATVQIRDPALDARSLTLSLITRSGPASADTVRATEDAILTRARQLRIQERGI